MAIKLPMIIISRKERLLLSPHRMEQQLPIHTMSTMITLKRFHLTAQKYSIHTTAAGPDYQRSPTMISITSSGMIISTILKAT